MNLKLEIEFSKADILNEVDALKTQVDDMRPLPPDVEGRVMQKLRLDWNYHSNAIEGNQLSYGETVAFLMEGITAKGKPLKDHLDIRGHNEAINFLLSIVKEDRRPLSESDIRALHQMILVEPYDVKAQTTDGNPTTKRITPGEYKTSPNHVQTATGEIHYYATPEETPAKMQELMEWYATASADLEIHPIVVAALFHHKFVAIHPFDDGNGRLSRILMNLVLMQKSYPPVVVKIDDRKNYYSLLSRADAGDSWPFIEYILGQLTHSMRLYLKAAQGEDIYEDEDIDKEIALFKVQIRNDSYKQKKSFNVISRVLVETLNPLVTELFSKAEKFDELFDRQFKFVEVVFTKNSDYQTHTRNHTETFSTINNSLINLISVRFSDFNKIEICYQYNSFKGIKKRFNISFKQTILFDTYYYSIMDNGNKLLVSKNYQENLNNDEKHFVKKRFIEEIKALINKEIEK